MRQPTSLRLMHFFYIGVLMLGILYFTFHVRWSEGYSFSHKFVGFVSIPGSRHEQRRPDHLKRYNILLWTRYFGRKKWLVNGKSYEDKLDHCPHRNCLVTSDRKHTHRSNFDAILFHLRDVNVSDVPRYKAAGQKWVLYNMESPVNSRLPNLTTSMIDQKIDWIASYRQDGDIYSPYAKIVPHSSNVSVYNSTTSGFASRPKTIAWFVSNCHTTSKREAYVNKLRKYIDVDIYGMCGKLSCPRSDDCYKMLETKYKYYLSFENSICTDYVTEKLFKVMQYNIVPIVMGGANYSQLLPTGSYIDVSDFKSGKELAKFLTSIDGRLYNSYFEWKKSYRSQEVAKTFLCQVCSKLNEHQKYGEVVQSRPNFKEWWYNMGNCRALHM